MITIYTTNSCPNCILLEEILNKNNIQWIKKDMRTPETMTELVMNNIYAMTAPIMKLNNDYYTNLALFGKLNIARIYKILEDNKLCQPEKTIHVITAISSKT